MSTKSKWIVVGWWFVTSCSPTPSRHSPSPRWQAIASHGGASLRAHLLKLEGLAITNEITTTICCHHDLKCAHLFLKTNFGKASNNQCR